ncbi:substrate-binding domain-containing protein [Blautia sp. HCP3S3_G3]|uniref:substrate-binding domain-containing protein n=1 Tax=Blautia sp. HCP3S3_G3 TaxID=3438913 RepID=UPI003F8AD746
MKLSARNQLKGKVININKGAVNSIVSIDIGGGNIIVATISCFIPDVQPESSILKRDYLLNSNGLILSGQTSAALELLCGLMAVHPKGMPILQSHMNTYNGLYALYFNKAHIAAASLSPEILPQLIPGTPIAAIYLYEYSMGFYVRSGNPKNIHSFQDLTRADVIFANREKGSTRRIYLDTALKKEGISPLEISGYRHELVSDLSTAAAIINGKADTAIGEEYISRQSGTLDFLPLTTIPMFLVAEADRLENPGYSAIVDIVRSDDFKAGLHSQTGYDVSRTGEILYL